ncbi:MAG TPA: hypothetical protein VGI90_14465 [Steroidobacteraceae bacterium]
MDTILNNVTDAELAAYFVSRAKMNPGMVWDGYMKPMLQAMDRKTRDEVLAACGNYGGEMETSKSIGNNEPLGLQFGGQNDEGEEVEGQAIVEGEKPKVGDAMRKWRGQDHSNIADMQKANEQFWKKG